ncbi:YDG domain-containing protein [Polaromonas sp. CT11-55]|uniref:YDG domain-containing protein n=1 Tax=Polaromonas sp. CT11-55 TaxID=3243045 RepID=UPI0039A46BC7
MRKPATAVLLLGAATAQAGPVGGQVTSGAASISQSGASTTITQSSQNASLNWKSFNVGAQESVNFVQPSASAIAVNRILDTQGSQILGQLSANGQVYLINPNGVLFGAGAQVNVGGLVASTLDVKDADLGSAQRTFSGSGSGSVVNLGTLNAAPGGYVALIGNTVRNQGSINAPKGSVALAAGSAATLTLQDNQLLKVVVDQSVLNSLAENGGLIRADGGQVFLSAGARDSLLASVVNNSGVIQARNVENRNGTIILLGGMAAGTAKVTGTLDASAPNGGNGGFIETSGAQVNIADSARITTAAPAGTTGTWLIDPVDFNIAASGGNITGAALGSNLGAGNVVILSSNGTTGTAGNVNVNDVVSWSANQLTLNAQNNININANLNASGTGKLALEYGQGTTNGTGSSYNVNNGAKVNLPAGNNFSTKRGSTGATLAYTVITDLGAAGSSTTTDLQGISGNLGGRYVLGADIDAAPTSTWNGGAGFAPIGTGNSGCTPNCFYGTFDGLGHTITGLTIDRTTRFTGLFGSTSSASVIRNVGLVGGSVRSSNNDIGALAGWNDGVISNSYASTNVSGGADAGGLVGGTGGSSKIDHSYATGNVNGSVFTGGLAGYNQGDISNSYSTGTVTSGQAAGGLVGYMLHVGTISSSYSSATVNSSGDTNGGLVGLWSGSGGSISNSYATGAVTGTTKTGGLVGDMSNNGGTITNSYAAGQVTGTAGSVGGLVGSQTTGTISGSFWDTTTTGQATSAGGGTGMTTAQMQQQANFNSATAANGNVNPNWDLANVWRIYDGHGRPLLKSLMTPVTVTVGNTSKTYDKLAWNGGTGISCSNVACGSLSGTISFGGNAQGAVNAGSYAVTASGLYSNQQGYDISYANGTLTVIPANLVVTGVSAANKVYDAGVGATLNGTASVTAIAGDTVSVIGTGSGTFADKNAGNGKAVTVTGYTLSGADAGNYTVVQPTGLTANITPASLAVTGVSAAGKVYDGTRATTFSGTATVTPLGTDVVLVGGGNAGMFTDKNVGNGKTVTGTSYFLGGADANNYVIVQPTGTANITPASLTVTGVGADSKVYNASDAATLNGVASVTAIAGDTVTVGGGSGRFVDKNVGNNKVVNVTGFTLGGADAGNYTVVQPAGVRANITPASLTVTGVGANNKVYDTTTAATLNGTASVAALGGDVVTVGGTGTGTFANKNVGNAKAITVTGYTLGGADAGNYTVVQPTAVTANITPASLTVTGVSANNKVYDTTAAATLGGTAAVTALAGDVVTVGGGSATFANKNVGNGKAVTVTGYTLGGADAGNYTVVQPTGLAANITPASLTVTGVGANNKVYDTTTTATLNGTASVAALGGDVVTLGGTGSGTFANKNVGNAKAVTVTGYTLGGADAGNYTVVQPTAVTANITPASLTVTGVSANNKVYDATTAATLGGTAAVTALAGDVVTVGGGTGTFANKNVGNGKAVTATGYTLGGADAGNYTVVLPTGLTANITPASLTVTGVGANNKVYDTTTAATLTGTASVAALGGDTVTVGGTGNGTFANKNVGNGKTVTVTGYTLGGADAGNYTVVQPVAVTANITPASLTVTGVGANNKVYDATTTATLNGAASVTALAGDSVTVGGTGSGNFANKNVGNGKAVTVTGYTLSGADAGNYTVVQPTGLTANITPASITVTGVSANNKVYDTTTAATLGGTASVAALGTDVVTVGGGSATFANKNVGNGKAVTVTGYTLGGADAGNYTVVQPTGLTANITPASITVTGVTANNKVYDTTTTATLSGTAAVTALGGDVVAVGGTGSGNFANKNVGNGKAVTVTGYTLSGADAGNYTIAQPTGVTANITPASLAVTGVGANNKVYDATTTATLNGAASVTALGGDVVVVGGTGAGNFANKNVGNGKAVTVTGYTLSGADAGNYTVVQPTGVTANITPASLAVTGVGANNKVYDTTTAATLNGTASVTALGTDVVALGGTGSGTFANKNAGNGKAVTVTGYTLSGADAGNYVIAQPSGVTANITPATLAVTGVNAQNKVFDGTTAATLGGTAAVTALAGDVVAVGGGHGAFADPNVGNGKAVTVTGFTLSGADAGNYAVVQPTGLTAAITPLPAAPAPATPPTTPTTTTTTSGRGLGADGGGIRSATQEALDTERSTFNSSASSSSNAKSNPNANSTEASSTLRVTHSASADASSGGEALEPSSQFVEGVADAPLAVSRKDPRLHIVDGGVQLRSGVIAAKK